MQDLALIGASLLLARLLDPPATPGKFGLRLTRLGPAVGWTLLSWVSFFAFATVWGLALGITEQDDLPDELGVDGSTAALVAVSLLVCVLAPIAEELFFRGFCFTALRRALGMLPAAALTGIIFGAIHLGGTDIEFIVPLMVFGFFLCLLYVWTDSLLPCIVLHALNNALALGRVAGLGGGDAAGDGRRGRARGADRAAVRAPLRDAGGGGVKRAAALAVGARAARAGRRRRAGSRPAAATPHRRRRRRTGAGPAADAPDHDGRDEGLAHRRRRDRPAQALVPAARDDDAGRRRAPAGRAAHPSRRQADPRPCAWPCAPTAASRAGCRRGARAASACARCTSRRRSSPPRAGPKVVVGVVEARAAAGMSRPAGAAAAARPRAGCTTRSLATARSTPRRPAR